MSSFELKILNFELRTQGNKPFPEIKAGKENAEASMEGHYKWITEFEYLERGVVEVSQEITEIRNLQGEKRLLDWEE